jgi:hypothetical protein
MPIALFGLLHNQPALRSRGSCPWPKFATFLIWVIWIFLEGPSSGRANIGARSGNDTTFTCFEMQYPATTDLQFLHLEENQIAIAEHSSLNFTRR